MVERGNELSDRENEILHLVATGASNKEIAEKLFISTNTVKVHLRNIFSKIGATTRTEAAMYAVNAGLVPDLLQGKSEKENTVLEESDLFSPSPDTKGKWVETLREAILTRPWLYGLAGLGLIIAIAAVIVWFFTPPPPKVVENPTNSGWISHQNMPTPRSALAVVAVHDRLFAVGGENNQGVSPAVEVFYPEIGKWSILSSMPQAAADIQAGLIGGKLYIPGGRLESGEISNGLSIYDPDLAQWSEGSPMPFSLSRYALAQFEGKLYLFGGWDGERIRDDVLEYDPSQDTWHIRTPITSPRADAAAVLIGNEIHLLGGFDGKKSLDIHQVYSPAADDRQDNPWRSDAHLPEPRYNHTAAAVMDVIYIVGGQNEDGQQLPAWGYLTKSGEWLAVPPPMDTNLTDSATVLLDSFIYVVGGEIDNTISGQMLSFRVLYSALLPFVP